VANKQSLFPVLATSRVINQEEEEAGIIYFIPSLRMVGSRTSGPGADGHDWKG
jgi:hypothetical protein